MEEYANIVDAITTTPWLILPESLTTIIDIVNMRIRGERFSDEEIRVRLEAKKASNNDGHENPRIQVGGGVGVISLNGPIFPKANLMTALSGATSLDTFTADLRELLANDSVKQIVMDINSPGGSADLVHETGAMIRDARNQKPIYAVANTTAASAALWLLSQATKAYATPSGKVGSLGVYTAHEDVSAQDAQQGRKITVISAGEYKTELSPHAPLSEKGRQYLQESVDEIKTEFVTEVAAGRGLDPQYVDETFGNAKVFSAKKAAEIKMVDGVMSINQLIGNLVEQNAATVATSHATHLQHHVARVQADVADGIMLTDDELRSLFHIEHKEEEHSAGGTGSPPQPRRDDAGEDDPAIVGGWRRDDLPLEQGAPGAPNPNPAKPNTNVDSGGESTVDLTDEQFAELRASCGLSSTATTDEVLERAKKIFAEHNEFRASLDATNAEAMFAQQNPAMYAEHQRLLEKDRKSEASAFANSVGVIKTQVGDKKEDSKNTLSALAVETITASHMKFAQGKGTLADFENAIRAITDGGVVMLGEIGSSTYVDTDFQIDTTSKTGLQAARLEFASKVNEVQAEARKSGNELDILTATKLASEKYPELAKAYSLSTVS